MRNVALVLLAIALLVLQTAVGTVVYMHAVAPNLLLPMVILLGVAPDVHVVRGAALSFVIGYLLDSFCGSPMGLQTFVMVLTFMVARGAGLRLFLRGPVFQIVLTFLASLLAGGTINALQAIFEPRVPFPAGTIAHNAFGLVLPAASTALVAPLVFAIVRRIEGLPVRRREEGAPAQ